MNREKIIKILEEQEYPKFMIENTINKIEAFTPSTTKAFLEWMESGTTPNIEVEGYSYDQLIEMFRMKPVGAFITLDWLIKDPKVAVIALKRGVK